MGDNGHLIGLVRDMGRKWNELETVDNIKQSNWLYPRMQYGHRNTGSYDEGSSGSIIRRY
jgi:hypothetical protein